MSIASPMHEAIKAFILNRKIQKEELLLTTKFEKDKDGGLNKILIKIIKSSGKCREQNLKEIADRKKSKEDIPLNFHSKKYSDLVTLARDYAIDISEHKEMYRERKEKIVSEHQHSVWLDDHCKYAEFASVATHVSKITHSSNKGTSFFDNTKNVDNGYLSTSTIKEITADGAYENALYSPVVSLLLVEADGRFFYQDIIQGEFEGLVGFTDDQQQFDSWKSDLRKSIEKPRKSSDLLSKQIYFPVKVQPVEKNDWHLLSVLVSSSLAQELFRQSSAKDFNDKNRNLKEKCRSKSLYSKEQIVSFPNKATLMVTQSSHQNTSILNGKRSGRLFLLPSTPPRWKSQVKPPINVKSWFYHGVPLTAYKEDIEYLRNFFLRFKQIELSTKDPKRRIWLIKWGRRILTNVMFHAESIQNLPAGWSSVKGIKLKPEYQYFLDPYRTDSEFQAAKENSDWQNAVASDFAQWLNRKIQGKDKKFTPQPEHTKLWKDLILDQLREHNEMVKAVLATNREEQV